MDYCSICSHDAHGMHYGVLTCRACAAFFRRCIVLNLSFKCRNITGNCETMKTGNRSICRSCRLQKCISMGMDVEAIQPSREGSSKNSVDDRNSDEASDELMEIFRECRQKKFLKDVNELGRLSEETPKFPPTTHLQIMEIFSRKESTRPRNSAISGLERMTAALECLRADQTLELEAVPVLNFEATFPEWERTMLKWARWMQTCEEFAKLDMKAKMAIFGRCWACLLRLERLAMSVEIEGEEVFTKRAVFIFDRYAIDEHTKFVAPFCTGIDEDKVRRIFIPPFDTLIDNICAPIFEMDLSNQELTYLFLHILWNFEDSSIDESVVRIADAARQKLSSDLHEYYQKIDEKMKYANRLIEILKIGREAEKIQKERNRIFEMARMFQFFENDSY